LRSDRQIDVQAGQHVYFTSITFCLDNFTIRPIATTGPRRTIAPVALRAVRRINIIEPVVVAVAPDQCGLTMKCSIPLLIAPALEGGAARDAESRAPNAAHRTVRSSSPRTLRDA